MIENTSIHHDEQRDTFTAEVGDQRAVLKYAVNGQTIDFTSTFVPETLRGHGLAEQLVHTGLAWARDEGFHIEASCWYVKLWLDRGK